MPIILPTDMHQLAFLSTRFNNITWAENQQYLEKWQKKWGSNPDKTGVVVRCIFGAPQPIADKILVNSWAFVCQMNNDLDKIMGIGLIKNRIYADKYYRVYNTGNFNRYIYKGAYHLSREQLIRRLSITDASPDVIEKLETALFKGKTHMKRGAGFSRIPWAKIRDIAPYLRDIFQAEFFGNDLEK